MHISTHRLLGMALGFLSLAGLGEVYCRLAPLAENLEYQGDRSPLEGPFEKDSELGVRYRSWNAFVEENHAALETLGQVSQPAGVPPTWALFGNSFVQAPGMLADVARRHLDRRIFNLGRNVALNVRVAQIQILVENGFRPERLFMVVLPLDAAPLGRQPLATQCATSRGGLAYVPRLPAGLAGEIVAHLALARRAWFRLELHYGDPWFRPAGLNTEMSPQLRSDLRTVIERLSSITRPAGVPVTALLIPNYEQIVHGAPTGFQNEVKPLLRAAGVDVFDALDLFRAYPHPVELFLPDKHFTPSGNLLLLDRLLEHMQTVAPRPQLPTLRRQP